MNDTELTKLLRGLPRTSASPRFTSEVMRELRREPESRQGFTWRVAAAFAMAACLVLVVQVALVQHARREQQRIDSLRAEQHRIEAELAAVKKLASEYEPVVVLEHADGTRVVLDQRAAETAADDPVVPASYSFD